MKNKIKIIGVGMGMLAISIFCQQAQANANLIAGSSIGFTGSYTANGTGAGDLMGATAITGVNSSVSVIPAPTGSFSTLGGKAATFNTPIALAATSTPAGQELWAVTSGANTYEFFTTASTAPILITIGSTAVDELSGTGFAEELTGATVDLGPTSGTWGITLNASGATFQFTGTSTVNAVPDGGTTMMMLGGAFCAIGALRRKISSK